MITGVVLTKNEEKNIVDCLESLNFCNEIIVVDDYSEDRTEEIASRYNARVIKSNLGNDFSRQRNIGLINAKNEWVLFVDADERVSKVLAKEIEYVTEENKFDGFFIKRLDKIWGKVLKHGETGSIKFIRLARKNFGRWNGKVHEKWKITGKVGTLSNPLLHYPHQSVGEFIREINYYSDIRAKELYSQRVTVAWYDVLFHPKFKFFLNYVFKLGFLDGIQGLLFAILMSFHSFLVRSKLWVLNQKKS